MNLDAMQALLDQIDGKKVEVVTKKEVYVRQWGEDSQVSKHYICTVIDRTTETLYLVGGVGTAEQLVDSLIGEGHEIHQFEGHAKKSPKSPVRVVSTGPRHVPGLMPDLNLKWETMKVVKGTADFHIMLHNHHGRRKRV